MNFLKWFLIVIGYMIGIVIMIACLFGILYSLQMDNFWQSIGIILCIGIIFLATREAMDELGRIQKRIGY